MGVMVFGKLPTYGDFVVRGMSADDRALLDQWLSNGMIEARAVLGDSFEDRYDRAPPWRFAAGDSGGVLVPSVDRAGRRFPVYLMRVGITPSEAVGAAEACEELIYKAFAEAWDVDELVANAAALTFRQAELVDRARWWTASGEGFPLAERVGAQPNDLLAAMLAMEEDA